MNRDEMIKRVADGNRQWDVVIIGGGATGLGVAVDAAARGYDTLLLEQHDFAKGTSSRSTKLIHGGVRYLKQGNVALVLEALHERGRLRRNAPHLVKNLPFVVPVYDWWEGPFYGVGLRLYDMLAGKLGLGPSNNLSREETLERIPTIEPDGLKGGVEYYDAQFDDARLAVSLARTAVDLGATVTNYARVISLTKSDSALTGVLVRDEETGSDYEVRARVVVNATGPFSDIIRSMDDRDAAPIMRHSQGVHIVLGAEFLRGRTAVMVPSTDDGRVLFAIPWHDRTLIGTTDTPVPRSALEPRPLDQEVTFLLEHAARYLTQDPTPGDILSMFAGLRPLVAPGGDAGGDTAAVSREHVVHVSPSGLVTIAGGKWTTYRKMAEDTIDAAAAVGGLPERRAATADLKLRGYTEDVDESEIDIYGSDRSSVEMVSQEKPAYGQPLVDGLPYRRGEVAFAVRSEMARTVEDVLARRTRALLLDARASIGAADVTAQIMADEFALSGTARETWIADQVASFNSVASRYIYPEG